MFLSEWLNRANKRFKQLNPLDSEDIVWEVGADGMRPTLRNKKKQASTGGGGDAYDGFFNSSKTDDLKVTISAGRWQLNLDNGDTAEEELTMSQSSVDEYIYLEGDVSGGGGVVVDLVSSTTFPVDEEQVFRGLICVVSFTDNVISSISNQQFGLMRGIVFAEVV